MAQTLEKHSMSRFILGDIQPKLKFDSRNPSVMDEISFYLNYSSFDRRLLTLHSMSLAQAHAACIPENADFAETLSEDDPLTLEDMADYERSKGEIDELNELLGDEFYIDYDGGEN